MKLQAYQLPELRDSQDNIIRAGSWGKKMPFTSSDNRAILDFIMNNFEVLWNIANGGIIPVASLPGTGDQTKVYLVTSGNNSGKTYRWTGTQFLENTGQINGLSAYEIAVSHGFIGTEAAWLESLGSNNIVSGTTDSSGNLVLTLQSGETVTIPITPLQEAMEAVRAAQNSVAVISGLAGLRFSINPDDSGIDVYY